jgi:hypothetical protein
MAKYSLRRMYGNRMNPSKEIRIVLLRNLKKKSGSCKCEAASIVFAMNELAKLVHQKEKMSL